MVLFETHGCVEKNKQNICYCRSVCLQVNEKLKIFSICTCSFHSKHSMGAKMTLKTCLEAAQDQQHDIQAEKTIDQL